MPSPRRFTAVVRAFVAAVRAGSPASAVQKKHFPNVHEQIAADARHPELLSLWGKSLNFDENVEQTIVAPEIVEAIAGLAGVPMRGRAVHAGLLHTYGYLFSVINTPYGLKRDRWLSKTLEHGFGFDERTLSDRPRSGTLLGNVTWLFGQIAFRDQPKALARLMEYAAFVAPELRRHDFFQHRTCRIIEQATLPATKRPITLITDLVPYLQKPVKPTAESMLLVYSVQIGRKTSPRLITGFPIQSDTMRILRESCNSRRTVPVRPRYNAYVPGFTESLPGRRIFVDA